MAPQPQSEFALDRPLQAQVHGQALITVSDCLLFKYTFLFGLCVALCWSGLVCVSRVYMGMHSVLVSLSSDYYETSFCPWLYFFRKL